MQQVVVQHPWVDTIPELATRSGLVEYLQGHPTQRRRFFKYVEDIISLAGRLSGHRLGAEIVTTYYQQYLRRMEKNWGKKVRDELGSGGERIFTQAAGCLKNVHLNALNRVERHVKFKPGADASPYFVMRNLERNPHKGREGWENCDGEAQ